MSEDEVFVEMMPEDYYAAEELEYGVLSKCVRGGKKKRKKIDEVLEGSKESRE